MQEYCFDELIKEVIFRLENTNGIDFTKKETLEKLISLLKLERPFLF